MYALLIDNVKEAAPLFVKKINEDGSLHFKLRF